MNWSVRKKNEKKIREEFKIPQYLLPIALITIGLPVSTPNPPARRRVEDFITYIDGRAHIRG